MLLSAGLGIQIEDDRQLFVTVDTIVISYTVRSPVQKYFARSRSFSSPATFSNLKLNLEPAKPPFRNCMTIG